MGHVPIKNLHDKTILLYWLFTRTIYTYVLVRSYLILL